jgi:hypothetical protein
MSTQYRLVQSGKTASGGCSAGPRFVRACIATDFFFLLIIQDHLSISAVETASLNNKHVSCPIHLNLVFYHASSSCTCTSSRSCSSVVSSLPCERYTRFSGCETPSVLNLDGASRLGRLTNFPNGLIPEQFWVTVVPYPETARCLTSASVTAGHVWRDAM